MTRRVGELLIPTRWSQQTVMAARTTRGESKPLRTSCQRQQPVLFGVKPLGKGR